MPDSFAEKIDAYVDAELSPEEMQAMSAHLKSCAACTADALRRTQLKRSVRIAGNRYTATADFRRRISEQIAPRRSSRWRLWVPALALVAMALVVAFLAATSWVRGSEREQLMAQVTDLHVTTLASSNPVDVVSSDRHTVKPWFQGKLPFTFNVPEFGGTEFTLVGGRMAYFNHQPGAELLVDVRKHHISVFIFQDSGVLQRVLGSKEQWQAPASFTTVTWSAGGLRYFAVGDAGRPDIERLSGLMKAAAGS